MKGKPHPKDCNHCKVMREMTRKESESKNRNWKGDNVGYGAIHHWLRVNFKNEKCENPNCSRKSKTLDWCLKKGKRYERRRENFIRLCRSCHCKYDGLSKNLRK